MLVRDVLFNDRFKHLHCAHYAEDTVIVSTVFYRVAVGRHYDTLGVGVCARDGCIDVCNIIYLDSCADSFHTLDELVPRH